ncbi:protein P21 [Brachypodium distachyon]|uniref:Thaumatin-like protein n=1 Tax=Brachypodium distachyon TaxID=15368 RepID=I1IH18_BRADI|nr:protein P21 [Brachypodium distachyon]KQJ86097.1 hypothetical protein BRADI_4g03290v3 [Brachypodium distachyon]|eukprot:XP_003578322.1 protein P21 [Brachypodium distachyon]
MAPPSLFIVALVLITIATVDATTFTIFNKCSYTVWPAAIPVGGGTRLDPGQKTTLTAPAGTAGARIWARTGCKFDSSGRGSCVTGDCGGILVCAAGGATPATLAEYTLGTAGKSDFYDISLVDGFNVPMSFGPVGGSSCHAISCAADINAKCPAALKVNGGCVSACIKFNTEQYCCRTSGPSACQPTDYSRFFKGLCPDAYSYAYDDKSSTFTCAAGTNYQVTFCP